MIKLRIEVGAEGRPTIISDKLRAISIFTGTKDNALIVTDSDTAGELIRSATDGALFEISWSPEAAELYCQ